MTYDYQSIDLVKEANAPGGIGKTMLAGLHYRLSERAVRVFGLEQFLEHSKRYGYVVEMRQQNIGMIIIVIQVRAYINLRFHYITYEIKCVYFV